jgi:hypothetical protein
MHHVVDIAARTDACGMPASGAALRRARALVTLVHDGAAASAVPTVATSTAGPIRISFMRNPKCHMLALLARELCVDDARFERAVPVGPAV